MSEDKIDEVELKYIRDSKSYNSMINGNAMSKELDRSNSYLSVNFENR
jgi:hypothetical protein